MSKSDLELMQQALQKMYNEAQRIAGGPMQLGPITVQIKFSPKTGPCAYATATLKKRLGVSVSANEKWPAE